MNYDLERFEACLDAAEKYNVYSVMRLVMQEYGLWPQNCEYTYLAHDNMAVLRWWSTYGGEEFQCIVPYTKKYQLDTYQVLRAAVRLTQ